MKRFFLFIISLVCINTLFCQTKGIDGIQAQQIWSMGHTISDSGEENFLSLYPDNIKPLPENIKALIAAFAVFAPVDVHYKNELAKLLGYLTLEEANQKLSKKWIADIENINRNLFFESLSFIRLDNKVFFLSGGADTDVLVFEENKKGKMTFKEKYDSSEMNRTESPVEMQARLKYEASKPATYDKGVIINGLKWAIRNVGTPNTFVINPEDIGMHYQFNRKIGWNQYSKEKWNTTIPEGSTWEKANDPCPAGWRLPNAEDLKTLSDKTKVDYDWVNQNGVTGVKFTDKFTKESIFLPYAGYRGWENGRLGKGDGWYWSSQQSKPQNTDCTDSPECRYMYYLYMLSPNGVYLSRNSPNIGFSVRCISE
jgi:uncharacterized protein (TIGR02145 family)